MANAHVFLRLTVLLLFHDFVTSLSTQSPNITTDQLALLALKSRVTFDPRNLLATNWSTSTSVCNWIGVTCDSQHFRVTELNLSGMGLVGTIPPHLGNLSFLSRLNMENNSFHASLPHQLSNLHQLNYVNLGNNNISGDIPSWFGYFTQLQSLFLNSNNFTGAIPSSLCQLPKLEILRLDKNKLKGQIPSIFNISSLQIIDLSNNSFSGSIPSIPLNVSLLQTIDFSTNALTGNLRPDMFDKLPNLRGLYLRKNLLSGRIPPSLLKCQKLAELSLSYNHFEGSLPMEIGNLTTLKILQLDVNKIEGRIPWQIGYLLNLETLSFSGNNITGSIPSNMGNLTLLKHLNLSSNSLSGQIPWQIVNLGNNRLEGSIPFELCHLQRLGYLTLTANKLSGPIPGCLGDVISLRNLFLGSNDFTSIPSTLTRLDGLLLLELSSNSLSGSLPVDIGNWKSLTNLNLSNNHFSGSIPSSTGDLTGLTHLSLSGNTLNGSIPQSIGELIGLEFLDLSRNNLSGTIPKSLEQISNLKYFNVSFNRLQGEIPNGGSFPNYSFQSFMGNEALCGSPRFQVLPCKTVSSRSSKKGGELLKYILPATGSTVIILAAVIIYFRSRNRKAEVQTQENLVALAEWRRISYHELDQATDGFCESNLVGAGSFGSVYQGTLSNGTSIAVKVFNVNQDRALKSFDVECDILCNIRHRNLVKIISSCSNLDFKALVLEFMPNGSLEKWLYSHNYSLDISQRLNIMTDIASALEYLHHGHTPPVVHCDLKPNNVLLDKDMTAHLGDFGIAKLLGEEDLVIQTATLATIGYMSPEYGSEGIVSTKGDVYSFGILLMETFARKKPMDETFVGEMSLKCWVKESLPSAVVHVIDANLLNRRERTPSNEELCVIHFAISISLCCRVTSGED